MIALQVHAHLAHGIAHGPPWAVSLDGIARRGTMGANRRPRPAPPAATCPASTHTRYPADLDLPLAKCTRAGGDTWHWAATCAYPGTVTSMPQTRYWTGRADHRALGQLAARLPASISDRQGPYRARVMPLLVTPTRTVCWRAVGDPTRIRDVLFGIDAIGKKRSQGEGRVLRWEIEAMPEIDDWTAGHLHPDGALGRPVPEACLLGKGPRPRTGGRGLAGIRPPYMHPARRSNLILPAS